MQNVKIWEETIIIPTYEAGPADKNPMFLEKRVYQGSSGKVYPYPTTDVISHEKTDKEYKAVWLENDYIKIMVLPELGGRIQRAIDKTNNYDFLYYNNVIKPALVGLLGPWVSGGIEFNWPQHHRPTTFMEVDYKLVENEDGSKSCIVNDIDQMYGTKGMAKFTLYPDKSYIEIEGQLYNRTSMPQTFLWWANPAVPANDHTRSIFPPDVHNVYDHGKRDVSRFPIATGTYYKYDYSDGVDISMYKNIPVPTSYMAESSDYNFVGGYDYSQEAGILHVANHHISPGKKQWVWGCGDFGQAWDRSLTDNDGPYVELMTGVYTDNQPDFTWLKPFEEKTFKQYFMPYKKLDDVKNASTDAVVDLNVSKEEIDFAVYTTGVLENLTIQLFNKENIIFEEVTKVTPTEIYKHSIKNEGYDRYDVKIVIKHNDKVLVEYIEIDQGIPKLADPAREMPQAEDILSNDELYLTGMQIEQYRHATFLPDPYYLEGLKRDASDTRINTAYGLLQLRRANFEVAQKHFETAIERLTSFNPNPYNSEAYYNLGLTQMYEKNYDDAYDNFYKATWSNEQKEMSFYYLAALDSLKGDYEEALDHVNKSLINNTRNIKALGLKAILLRKLKEDEKAKEQRAYNLSIDAFDYVTLFEQVQAKEVTIEEFLETTRGHLESHLNAAKDFIEVGEYERAEELLLESNRKKPMINYYLAYTQMLQGKDNDAKVSLDLAEACDPTYTFPNKLEDVSVLKYAIENNPKGSKAYYYLGNLYYDKLQFDKAIELWKTSAELDDTYATVFRNLALANYNKLNDEKAAVDLMSKAFACDESDARIFLELDQLLRKTGVSIDDRFNSFNKYMHLVDQRDDLYLEYVTLLNLKLEHQKAYDAIMSHKFRPWEGAEGKVPTQYKIALLELAKQAYAKEDYNESIELLERALVYPENLGEGKLIGTKDNNIYYYLGLVYEKLNDEKKAKECFELATHGADEPASIMYYYDQPADMILFQGLAKEKLEEQKEGNAKFYKLLNYGENHLRDDVIIDYFAVSIPDFLIFEDDLNARNQAHCYYLMGLANLGLENYEEATEHFDKALAIDGSHQNCLLYKSVIENQII